MGAMGCLVWQFYGNVIVLSMSNTRGGWDHGSENCELEVMGTWTGAEMECKRPRIQSWMGLI